VSYTHILYHIVIVTQNREPCFVGSERLKLYDAISGVIEKNGCRLYRINAVAEHAHVLCSLNPDVQLTDLINDIRSSSSGIIDGENLFPGFGGWEDDYYAFTCSYKDKASVSKYVERQQVFHREVTFDEELEAMLKAAGMRREQKSQ
jgi:putative transposase